jgi:transcriptional regulator with XRE-family HTH domain
MTPGEYLRSVREKHGLPLRAIATIYACSVPYLSDLERGLRAIPKSRTDREALCEAYLADEALLDAHVCRATGTLDLSDLDICERDRVIAFVAKLRRTR